MALDLAKLGQEVLAARVGSLEGHSRFFETLVGSFAVGVLYWALRCPFRTSRAAALAGAFRLEETNIIELHHLMLASTLLGFFLATALAAHIAGARNLLQFIGALCLATGASIR
jgi:hypothetical protein